MAFVWLAIELLPGVAVVGLCGYLVWHQQRERRRADARRDPVERVGR